MSWYGDNDLGGDDWWTPSSSPSSPSSSSLLPYSTTASAPAPAAAGVDSCLPSRSSLPFQAPRASFDDSLPTALSPTAPFTDEAHEWSKLGLLSELVEAVTGDAAERRGLGLTEGPTPVQRMAIPEILAGCVERMVSFKDVGASSGAVVPPARSVAFVAATGLGKTLVYLLPMIQSFRTQELAARSAGGTQSAEALAQLRCSRAVVLAPTRELVRQIILGVLKSVGHVCKV